MTMEVALCLTVLVAATVLFAWDRYPPEVVSLGVMLSLILSGLLSPESAFAGFSSDTVMMILGLLIMTAGLVQTGIVEIAGNAIFELAGKNQTAFFPLLLVAVATISAFMSNTAATAVFIPLVMGYAAKTGVSPSRYLLPVAFASLVTSSTTLISTSTNIVVSEQLKARGLGEMGFFELVPAGVPIAITGLLYMWLIGPRLLPHRGAAAAPAPVGERKYQADVVILDSASLAGKPLAETPLKAGSGLKVLKGIRNGAPIDLPVNDESFVIEAGDEYLIEGLRAELLQVKNFKGVEFKAELHLTVEDAEGEDLEIVEGVLLPASPLIGRTLSSLNFKDRYGLQVLAIHRAGPLPAKMSRARLRLGDVLLLQGKRENVAALERGNLFNIFGGVDHARLNMRLAPVAAIIFVTSIVLATVKLVTLPVATLLGALAMLVGRCIAPDEAYRQIEWKVLILIGSLLSLGAAMEETGAGKFLAGQLIATGAQNSLWLLSIFFWLAVALTQVMSNQAAAVVLIPIAIEAAAQTGVNPRPLAMMVVIAASCSYLSPLEPSCLLVYGPGKYTLRDFLIVGLPLTCLIFVIAIILVPIVWPLR